MNTIKTYNPMKEFVEWLIGSSDSKLAFVVGIFLSGVQVIFNIPILNMFVSTINFPTLVEVGITSFTGGFLAVAGKETFSWIRKKIKARIEKRKNKKHGIIIRTEVSE